MSEFLCGNGWQWRLLRAIVRGVLGVVVANVDLLVGQAVLDPTWRAGRCPGDGCAVFESYKICII